RACPAGSFASQSKPRPSCEGTIRTVRRRRPRGATYALTALTAAGVSPAVPTRVATASPHHPPAAFGALDGVFPVVEQGGLAWRGGLGSTRLRRGLLLAACVRRR